MFLAKGGGCAGRGRCPSVTRMRPRRYLRARIAHDSRTSPNGHHRCGDLGHESRAGAHHAPSVHGRSHLRSGRGSRASGRRAVWLRMDDHPRRGGGERRRSSDRRDARPSAPRARRPHAARGQARDGGEAARDDRERRPRDGCGRRAVGAAPDGRLPRALEPALHGREELRGSRRSRRTRDGLREAERHDLGAHRDAAVERAIRPGVVPLPAYDGHRALAVRPRPGRGHGEGLRGVLERRGISCWDAIQAIVEFEGGAFCTFETSWIVPDSYSNVVDNRLSIYGEKGGLEIRNEPSLWAFTDRFHTPFSSESVTRYGKVWGYQYEPIRYFVDCVADGLTPEASGADGLIVTAMIEATLRSLAEKYRLGSPTCSMDVRQVRLAWRTWKGRLDERDGPVQVGRQAGTRDRREPRPRPRHGAGARRCRRRHRHHRTHGRDPRDDGGRDPVAWTQGRDGTGRHGRAGRVRGRL